VSEHEHKHDHENHEVNSKVKEAYNHLVTLQIDYDHRDIDLEAWKQVVSASSAGDEASKNICK